MVVLLPEGRAIANPDSIKLVKIIASEINKKKSFVVVVKIDDDPRSLLRIPSKRLRTSVCVPSTNGGDEDGSGAAADDDFEDDDLGSF